MFILRIFIGVLICSLAYGDIRKTTDLQTIKREIFASPKDTLVVFDIDLVLIIPDDEIFLLHFKPEGKQLLKTTLDQKASSKDIPYFISIIMNAHKFNTVTPDTAKVFNQIKAKGYKVLGLTASGTGAYGVIPSLEAWRVQQLKELDIVFDKYYKDSRAGALDRYIPNVGEYHAKTMHACFPAAEDGIIFTCGVPKGETLDAYLQYAKIKPKKIVFIDDMMENLQTVEKYCQDHNIDFVGFEYDAVKEKYKDVTLNLQRFKLRFMLLELTKTWISEKQADQIIETIQKSN